MDKARGDSRRFTDVNVAHDDPTGNLSDEEALFKLQIEMKDAGISMEIEEEGNP